MFNIENILVKVIVKVYITAIETQKPPSAIQLWLRSETVVLSHAVFTTKKVPRYTTARVGKQNPRIINGCDRFG